MCTTRRGSKIDLFAVLRILCSIEWSRLCIQKIKYVKKSLEKVCLDINFIYLWSTLLHKKDTEYLMFDHYLCCINEQHRGWIAVCRPKGKQFLHVVDGVCAMLKNALNSTTFIKVYRVETSFFHRILLQFWYNLELNYLWKSFFSNFLDSMLHMSTKNLSQLKMFVLSNETTKVCW